MMGPMKQDKYALDKLRESVYGIINSYEQKVNSVISLMKEVKKRIEDSYNEQALVMGRLKNTLAQYQSVRKSDFNSLINPIIDQQNRKKEEIHRILENFCKEEKNTADQLRSILTGDSSSNWEEFEILKERLLNRPSEREVRISRLLKDFHCDQEELNIVLRQMLEKDTNVRYKDLKAAIKAFSIEHHEEGAKIDNILDDFCRIKDKVNQQWHEVMSVVVDRSLIT